jgi:hypothetical protein
MRLKFDSAASSGAGIEAALRDTTRRTRLCRGHGFFAQKSTIKADEIAARQLHVLPRFQGPREKTIDLGDVKAMFLQMKDRA